MSGTLTRRYSGMDDTTAACNLIDKSRKSTRKKSMRSFRKSITTRISIEHGRQLSVSMQVMYDPKTDSVVVGIGLRYCRHAVHPGTKQGRNCHSQRGINILHASRARNRVYRVTHKEELNVHQKEYYATHKEERNERRRARYAAKKSSPRECYFEPGAL